MLTSAGGHPAGCAIRLTTSDDLGLLPAIEDAAALLLAPYDMAEVDDTTVSADLALTAQAATDGRLWVAVAGSEVVGFALAIIVDGEAHLHEIDVLPAYGRLGMGRALVAALQDWAWASDFPAVTLSTRLDVPFNGPFYARLGFVVVPAEELTPGLLELRRDEQRRGLSGRRAIMRRHR